MVPITHGNSSCDSVFESTLMMKWGGVCCVSKLVGFDAHNLLCMEASDPWRIWYLTNVNCIIFFLAQNRNGVQNLLILPCQIAEQYIMLPCHYVWNCCLHNGMVLQSCSFHIKFVAQYILPGHSVWNCAEAEWNGAHNPAHSTSNRGKLYKITR